MKLLLGNCLEKLKELEDSSIDSIVTDPPYELGFMGKGWDSTGIANNKEMWAECLRVLKPGGHLLAFSGTRTYHRMAVAIEDAGFEVRDMIEWVYGSGFPKSRNIGLDVDKKNGITKNRGKAFVVAGQSGQRDKDTGGDLIPGSNTMGAYLAQNEWSGWGTALKPAHEPICMARKPLAEKTVAENCLKWGTGGINIDESRVGTERPPSTGDENKFTKFKEQDGVSRNPSNNPDLRTDIGRFPANLIHDNSEEVRECFPETKSGKAVRGNSGGKTFGGKKIKPIMEDLGYEDGGGNASRFFKSIYSEWEKEEGKNHEKKSLIYQAKASKSERNRGCDGLEEKQYSHDGREKQIENPYQRNKSVATNNHPTVKPVALMKYLIKMVTPKNGTVLDPFMGSGSTGVAAKQSGYNFVGIEMEDEYMTIAKARIDNAKPVPQQTFIV